MLPQVKIIGYYQFPGFIDITKSLIPNRTKPFRKPGICPIEQRRNNHFARFIDKPEALTAIRLPVNAFFRNNRSLPLIKSARTSIYRLYFKYTVYINKSPAFV